jgi:hypothetical protein
VVNSFQALKLRRYVRPAIWARFAVFFGCQSLRMLPLLLLHANQVCTTWPVPLPKGLCYENHGQGIMGIVGTWNQ